MAQELVTVFTATNEVEAEIIKNALESEDIRAIVEGPHQAGEVGLLGIGVKVQVAAADADRAREIVEEGQRRMAADADLEDEEEEDDL
jgi:Putative prokaryotic signal transducing protein